MRQLYSVRKERLGMQFSPAKKRQARVEDLAHDVAVAGRAEELQAQQGADGVGRRESSASREAGSARRSAPRAIGAR